MHQAEHFLGMQCELGEGPLWDHRSGLWYWVDINAKRIHHYDPGMKRHKVFQTAVKVGALGLRKQGGFVAATSEGLGFWEPQGNQMHLVVHPEKGKPGARFNDGKVGPDGCFWAGTMTFDDASSSLYRWNPDLSVQTLQAGITISNGLGWSPGLDMLYHADTRRQTIFVYAYDQASGAITNQRAFCVFQPGEGFPDGLTVDAEGNVWCALWGGWRVVCLTPEGKIVDEVQVPTANPSCCAFGGGDLGELLITTAFEGMRESERAQQPLAGDLFMVRPGVKGRPEPQFLG